jgi:hypothetical protein
MVTRRSPLLVVVLLCGVLVAGCGSSSSSSSSTQAATTSSTPSTTATIPGGSSSQIVQSAVAACRAGVAHAAVSASVKAKLETICNEAAKGNLNAAREAAKKVCVEIVNSSPIPAGAAKEAALSACQKVDSGQ